MFTVQYQGVDGQSHMQTVESRNRTKLAVYLAEFPHPILAVYEQANPITKAIRKEMERFVGVMKLSAAARNFITSPA